MELRSAERVLNHARVHPMVTHARITKAEADAWYSWVVLIVLQRGTVHLLTRARTWNKLCRNIRKGKAK